MTCFLLPPRHTLSSAMALAFRSPTLVMIVLLLLLLISSFATFCFLPISLRTCSLFDNLPVIILFPSSLTNLVFSVKDIHTLLVILRCNSDGDLYRVAPASPPSAPHHFAGAAFIDLWYQVPTPWSQRSVLRFAKPWISSPSNVSHLHRTPTMRAGSGSTHAFRFKHRTIVVFSPSNYST